MTALQVLYVDDEPDIREIAGLALQLDPGIEVRLAESGARALELLLGAWRPDVILLDVMMPAMDGPAVLAALREQPRWSTTPVVFITARTQAQDRQRLLELGAVALISKPFDPMTLAKEVRGVLAGAEAAA
ncbi:MAG TPA: response regulator [Caulobacteraceae bacterium]|nr:response regulator [Caulobacteraceae bacterium]